MQVAGRSELSMSKLSSRGRQSNDIDMFIRKSINYLSATILIIWWRLLLYKQQLYNAFLTLSVGFPIEILQLL